MRQFSIRVGKVKVKPAKGLGPINRIRKAKELAVIAELMADKRARTGA